jgi:hypothetical protein
MNLWYAGIVVAMLLAIFGGEHARRFAARLMTQMPVIIALGINLGIVPLLFLQVGFAEVFYPATILMAWFWLAVIALLAPAYYGVYLYALGLAAHGTAMPRWRRAAGWAAALAFLAIGFLFANALSLMENVPSWPELWQRHSFHGAALGTALNVIDRRLLPRWLLMFGLALTTTAVWVAVDAAWFAARESREYRAWAKNFAWKLYTCGAAWFLVAGTWYSFGTWSMDTRQKMIWSGWIVLTAATAVAPAGPWLLLWLGRGRGEEPARGAAALLGLAQFGVLGINAVSRQMVQHLEIRPYFDVLQQATQTQWAPLLIFLALFVAGLAVVAWMVYQVAKLPPAADATS